MDPAIEPQDYELVQPSGDSNVLPKGVPIGFVPSGLVDTLPPVSA